MTQTMGSDSTVALALEDPGDVGGADDDDDRDCRGGEMPETPCVPATAKTAFCGALNEGLSQYRLPAYDCSQLDVERTFPSPELDGEIACKRQIVAPAGGRTRAAHPGCSELVRTWENRSLSGVRESGMCGGSPLVLDLDGDGIQSSRPRPTSGSRCRRPASRL